jgi:hypothetical protein
LLVFLLPDFVAVLGHFSHIASSYAPSFLELRLVNKQKYCAKQVMRSSRASANGKIAVPMQPDQKNILRKPIKKSCANAAKQ